MDGPQAWLDIIGTGGGVGSLVLLVWLLLTKKLVPGWYAERLEQRNDHLEMLLERGLKVADRVTYLAERDKLGRGAGD